VHKPSHVTYPGLQEVPFRQVLPIPLQLAPQEPQLKSSSCRSAQEKLQFVCPERQPLDTLSFEREKDSSPSSYLILVLEEHPDDSTKRSTMSMIPAAGNGIFTIRTFLYPEFFGENKNMLNYFFRQMTVRLLPEVQQEPLLDTGSIL
jgi:hypothetical protein